MSVYGFARASADGQSLNSQHADLYAAGCVQVIRGSDADLRKILKQLKPGDVLMVTRLNRLAGSTGALLNILNAVARAGAGFKSLNEVWADTTTSDHGHLTGTILSGLAKFEQETARAKSMEGITRAKARAIKLGRPSSLTASQRDRALRRLAKGETQAEIALTFGVTQATISRLLKSTRARS
jgi:DNA invertase Pin-like site-specific DNA recombinase